METVLKGTADALVDGMVPLLVLSGAIDCFGCIPCDAIRHGFWLRVPDVVLTNVGLLCCGLARTLLSRFKRWTHIVAGLLLWRLVFLVDTWGDDLTR